MNLCVKVSNGFPFQKIEGWALIRRGRFLDIPVTRVSAYLRVGAYSRGHLIEALRMLLTVYFLRHI